MNAERQAGRGFVWFVTLLTFVVLSGCGAGIGSKTAASQRTGGAPAAGFPVTVQNCGVTTVYESPPERAVTLNQHATEVLLALGLEDRMAGTAYLDDAIRPEYRDAYRDIPVLAKTYPSLERLLTADPDFVYGGYTSAFDPSAGRSRERLAELGIHTYLNREQCADGPVTMDTLAAEITTVGRIFGVPERAEKLVSDMRRRIDQIRARVGAAPEVPVFVYDSGQRAPLTAGGAGIGNTMITLAGGRNVFADVPDSFAEVSWEQVVARQPHVIVIYDYGDTSVERKKRFLLSQPTLADVPAIRERNFAVLPLSSVVLGVRVPGAVEHLARVLHPEPRR